jgi:hypothetical protein
MRNLEIVINLDLKCSECGKKGALASGICMNCVIKILDGKPMNSKEGKAVKQRLNTVEVRK